MSRTQENLRNLASLLWTLFEEFGDYECRWNPQSDGSNEGADLQLISTDGQKFAFHVTDRERVTPQMADDLFARMRAAENDPHVVRLVYAPVISERVAEIARRYNVSYIDFAGNCRIVNPAAGLFISRAGIPNDAARQKKPAMVDLFAPKSSRIIRAMLHQPTRGWQVSELAEHPDIGVSAGLVSKIKQTLVSESYAVVRDRLLYLKEPRDLLVAWAGSYPGATVEHQYYLRGDTQEIESRLAEWCEKSNIDYALARFSAAWRHSPEVRYSVASVYVGAEAFEGSRQESLRSDCGARPVDSGASLVLLVPYDESVFAQRQQFPEQVTSALQTWLDLQSLSGRGVEAADAVFEKHLRESLEPAGHVQGTDS
ncbi:MAG: hypothetical protein ACI8P0_001303 [Planctomycetaceae bacterium]|jgi:hypothetical protein